jgi:hypothetical protein
MPYFLGAGSAAALGVADGSAAALSWAAAGCAMAMRNREIRTGTTLWRDMAELLRGRSVG